MGMTLDLAGAATIDLNVLVDTRLLIQANSGGGKSWCLRRLLEQTHGKVQHLVIDPEGEFSTLRERFDYVLAAKQGGDTIADPRSAKLLAERLLELGVSAVLDIYELKAHERVRFVKLFLEALIDAPKALWHPALVVVDEAHVYCPQKGEAESAGAVIDLATRGRKRGFCAVLATQRLSKLHKDAAAECNNKLIGRTALDVDVDRAGDELGLPKGAERNQLRQLVPGEFYVYGPAFMGTRTHAGMVRIRVDAVQTTHPKAGARIQFKAPPPTAKVKALLPKLADLPAEAEQRQQTEAELRKEISTLRRQLTEAQKAHPAPKPETKTVERFALKDGQLARAEKLIERADAIVGKFKALHEEFWPTALTDSLKQASMEIAEAIRKTREPAPAVSYQNLRAAAERIERTGQYPAPPRARPVLPKADTNGGDPLSKGERQVLVAILQVGGEADRTQISLLTGYSRSTRDRYLYLLQKRGLVVDDGGKIYTAENAVDVLGDYEPLPTGDALRQYWLNRLPQGERNVLTVVSKAWPESVDRDTISSETGYSRSTRDRYLYLLQARKLVAADRGTVKASDALFG